MGVCVCVCVCVCVSVCVCARALLCLENVTHMHTGPFSFTEHLPPLRQYPIGHSEK